MDLLVAPFKGDTEDPALILAATYTTAIKSAQVRSRFVSFSTRLRRSVHALHGDGIYRNFFVNTKSPKAPIQPLSGEGGGGWDGEGGRGGEIGRGSRKEDRFSSCIPRIYRFFLLRFGGSSRDKTNDIRGKRILLLYEDAGDECICFSFLFLFFLSDRMAR